MLQASQGVVPVAVEERRYKTSPIGKKVRVSTSVSEQKMARTGRWSEDSRTAP